MQKARKKRKHPNRCRKTAASSKSRTDHKNRKRGRDPEKFLEDPASFDV
jgi:hypothetical protein